MLSGPNLEEFAKIGSLVNTPLIASGGVHTLDDVVRIAGLGVAGCIVGRALYEKTLELPAAIEAARVYAAE